MAIRKLVVVLMVALVGAVGFAPARASAAVTFTERVVATGLNNPYEIIYGPDGFLWVTEKSSGKVLRINPTTGAVSVAATIAEVTVTAGAQDGLLGMALQLPNVYLAYSYGTGTSERFKITRYTYDATTGLLGAHTDVLTGLPASTDHDSGRIALGPDGKLYYTIGDQGNNQFARTCMAIQSQTLPTAAQVAAHDWSAYQGKTLRMNLDGSIPSDNPLLNGVRSHVWTYGHRNAQGLVFGRGKLYSSEQGPKTDDEINWLRSGRNYGWPRVAGFKDNSSYAYANWSASTPTACSTLTYSDYVVPASVPQLAETTFTDPAYAYPMRTLYTEANGFNFQDPRCASDYNICWPTVAPSNLDYYDSTVIPGWQNSLLMTTLKVGAVYRIPLSADGTTVASAPVPELRTVNRYRDTAISPDNHSIFVATDKSGSTRALDGTPTTALQNPGAILEFTY